MFKNPSLITRIAIGKVLGLIFGLLGFAMINSAMPEATPMLSWGILLWYITFGALIGIFGVFTYHPVLKIPMPWWFRDPFMGAWMNFLLALLAYNELKAIMIATLGADSFFASPFWFVLEGAIVGLFIGYVAKRYGGEGKATVDEMVE